MQNLKDVYLIWYSYYQILPKTHRYSLGKRVDNLFIDNIEAIATASFLSPDKKMPYIQVAISKTDTIKILLMILWEAKSLDDKKYIEISLKVDVIGKMLGGWNGQIQKQNSPLKGEERR